MTRVSPPRPRFLCCQDIYAQTSTVLCTVHRYGLMLGGFLLFLIGAVRRIWH